METFTFNTDEKERIEALAFIAMHGVSQEHLDKLLRIRLGNHFALVKVPAKISDHVDMFLDSMFHYKTIIDMPTSSNSSWGYGSITVSGKLGGKIAMFAAVFFSESVPDYLNKKIFSIL